MNCESEVSAALGEGGSERFTGGGGGGEKKEEKQTLPLSTHCQLLWLPKDLQAGPLHCVDSADLKCKCWRARDAVHTFPFHKRQVGHTGTTAEKINKQSGRLFHLNK